MLGEARVILGTGIQIIAVVSGRWRELAAGCRVTCLHGAYVAVVALLAFGFVGAADGNFAHAEVGGAWVAIVTRRGIRRHAGSGSAR